MEREPQARSPLAGPAREFGTNNPNFRLNKVAAVVLGDGNKIKLQPSDATWTGVYSRTPTPTHERTISYGTEQIPVAVAQRWGIADATEQEQLVYKFAHELAHAYLEQSGYETALIQWLDGSDDSVISDAARPFLELYGFLVLHGRVSGLSTEEYYRRHTEATGSGKLQIPVLEDMTELVAAYFLGDEYFEHKLMSAVTPLSHEQKTEVKEKVIAICSIFA